MADRRVTATSLVCTTCSRVASDKARGWLCFHLHRVEDPDDDEPEPPELAFYCPYCAEREFNRRIRGANEYDF